MVNHASSSNKAKDFLQVIIDPKIEEVGLLIDDIREWRSKNQIQVLNKAQLLLSQKSVLPQKISVKLLAQILENVSWEEDVKVQDRWAALLANTVAHGGDFETTLYSSILKEMSSDDAKIFEMFCLKAIQMTGGNPQKRKGTYMIPTSALYNERANADVSVDNLIRLRLIKEIGAGNVKVQYVMLTDLGFNFFTVVSW